MDDFLNNFPFVLPKVLLNAIRKYKRINSSLDKENRINNMNRNNNYSNKSSSCNGTHNQEIVVNPVDYEIKNLDKTVSYFIIIYNIYNTSFFFFFIIY